MYRSGREHLCGCLFLFLFLSVAELEKNPVSGFDAGLEDDSNLFKWSIFIFGPPDTIYEGGLFKATLEFPEDYPLMPPKMKFISRMWHPNVYPDGTVCISILHAPGDDEYGYETAQERWLPIHTVETILVSVISMLSSPNDESPANIEAAKEYRQNPEMFKRRVKDLVRKSQEDYI
eukprot:TRINITY_DN922_c0_g1_i2.p1 TRINITY_DN922_c0_g1~~TRINITY_DN922_c0_g1_i2.p1  ORF type:complete len:176 (+),score=35.70 TRINITY_DN922_c0_g1_i2:335-862(+)